jgi:hypothetical protein
VAHGHRNCSQRNDSESQYRVHTTAMPAPADLRFHAIFEIVVFVLRSTQMQTTVGLEITIYVSTIL